MSVVGIDLGNDKCVVAVARQRGVDVLLNEESKRENPSIVSFSDHQRIIGAAAEAAALMNPANSVTQIKRLIGRTFSDLQPELDLFPFKVTEAPDGLPLVHVRYRAVARTFTPTQILAMLLSHLKSLAENHLDSLVSDCCISIPAFFTNQQRKAVLDAAAIAGLRPLRLMHEVTAAAMEFGIYKANLPETEGQTLNVALVDVGHACVQVCLVAYWKGHLRVLAHAFNGSLGGRDFDEVLFRHFAARFKEKTGLDVLGNARACVRLRTACEKVKKVLSANPEAPLNVECLMEDCDFRDSIKREDFEQLCGQILERVKITLQEALADSGLSVQEIDVVEVVGSGSRVPAILGILSKFFGKEPRRTMNASECIARGCALQCAILSPTFRVRPFEVLEYFPFAIAVRWKLSLSGSKNDPADDEETNVFPKGDAFPANKTIRIFGGDSFTVELIYYDASRPEGQKISTYKIGPCQLPEGESAAFEICFSLDHHGIVSMLSAAMVETVENPLSTTTVTQGDALYLGVNDAPVQHCSVDENGSAMDVDSHPCTIQAPASAASDMECDTAQSSCTMASDRESANAYLSVSVTATQECHDMCDQQNANPHVEPTDASAPTAPSQGDVMTGGTEGPEVSHDDDVCNQHNANPNVKEKPMEHENHPKLDREPLLIAVTFFECIHGATSQDELKKVVSEKLQKSIEEEKEMALHDRLMEETKDRRNAVETYIYDTRKKIRAEYRDFVGDLKRETLYSELQKAEDWLYEEGEDVDKDAYIAKLGELKKLGDPVEELYKEYLLRDHEVNELFKSINRYRYFATSNNPRTDHIGFDEKSRLAEACDDSRAWLDERLSLQNGLPKSEPPVLSSSEILQKRLELCRVCEPILSRQRPVPRNQQASEPRRNQNPVAETQGRDRPA